MTNQRLSWNDETIRSRVPQRFRLQIAADRRQIGVHAGPNGGVQTGLTILRAKDDVNNNY